MPEAQAEKIGGGEQDKKELLDILSDYEKLSEKYEKIQEEIRLLELQEKNAGFAQTFEIPPSKNEPYSVNTNDLLENLINKAGREEIKKEIKTGVPNSKKVINLSEYFKYQTEQAFSTKEKFQKSITNVTDWVKRKFRRTLMALLVVGNFSATTSFSYKYSDQALAYDNLKVENLNDWNNIKLYEEEINKLDNISIINEFKKDKFGKYLIIDKSAAMAHLYEQDSLISSYEVGIGLVKGDKQTKTVVKDGKTYWEAGNMQTGAGIYQINAENSFAGSPSFTLINERGIEVPTVLHKTTWERNKLFNDENTENNRMSNGCINFQAHSIGDMVNQGVGKGTEVFILPDDPHNKFALVNGDLRFISNEKDVNKTIRPYKNQEIVARAENINENGKEFLQTLSEQKLEIMRLYPGVPNSVYNELVKVSYGIFGQESSFGTYGGPRGQIGRITDKIGSMVGKNISGGVTQIRITSTNENVRKHFNINHSSDLFDVSKASIATISHLLDIYVNNIPNGQKGRFAELCALHYNNPKEFKNAIKNNKKKLNNRYVNNVLRYGKSVKIYINN